MLITNIEYTTQIAVLSLNFFFFLFIQFCSSLWQIAWFHNDFHAYQLTVPLNP